MNTILLQRALELVPDRHVLINLIASRVRQLNLGNAAQRRSLLADGGNRSKVDTALLELIEGRMAFEMPEIIPLKRPSQAGNRPKGWTRVQPTEVINAGKALGRPPASPLPLPAPLIAPLEVTDFKLAGT